MSNTIITARIIDQSVQIINKPLLASGSADVLQIHCEFDSLWDGYGKTAVFYRTEDEVYHIPLVMNVATVPHEVLTEEGYFYFGVFGNKDNTRTTETVRLELKQGALTVSNADHGVPTPDIYQQLVQAYAQLDWQVVEDKARIDQLIKMHGGGASDSIVFNLGDEYLSGTILYNGTTAYLSATWDGMTLDYGRTHISDYCIPPHLVPMIETKLEFPNTLDLVAYLEPAEEEHGWGRIRLTNVADTPGLLNIQNEACFAMYPLANLTIRELADMRVGYDGTTYNLAGDALRGQIRALYAALAESGGGGGGSATGGVTVMFVQPNPNVPNHANLHSGEICNHVMAGGLAVFLDNRTGNFDFYQLTAADPQRADFVKITNDSVLVMVSVFEDYHTEWKEYPLLNQEDLDDQVAAAVEEATSAAVAEALTPHVNNKNNPHGVTAAQVGARPNTWLPTASEVGARASDWLPTIAEIGAAPTGFGLGGTCVNAPNDNLDAATANGWYSCSSTTAGRPTGLKNIEYGTVFVVKRFGQNTTQLYVSQPNTCVGAPYLLVRDCANTSAWNPWEWINPPMLAGVEYRTTDRIDGKAVYKRKTANGVIEWKLDGETQWKLYSILAGSIQQSANYYSSGKSADDLGTADSLALIPCNTTTNTELYAIVGSTYAYVLTLYYSTIAQRVQIAVSYATNPPRMAFRTLYGGTWTPWTRLSSGILCEFDSGAVNIASGNWTHASSDAKLYVLTVKVNSASHTLVINRSAIAANSNSLSHHGTVKGTEFYVLANIEGSNIKFTPSNCTIINVCAYY